MKSVNATPRVLLGELLLRIETGRSIQTTERLARDNELGVLKVSAVSWGAFNPKEAKVTHPGHKPQKHHRVQKGDVLISRANTVELVGAVVKVQRDYPNRLLSDKTLRLVLDENRCDPDYVVQVLRLPEARAHLEEHATGTSNSMRNVSQDTIRATPIRLPSIPEQKRIAAKLRILDEQIAKLRGAIKAQLGELNLLRAKLVAQVFES